LIRNTKPEEEPFIGGASVSKPIGLYSHSVEVPAGAAWFFSSGQIPVRPTERPFAAWRSNVFPQARRKHLGEHRPRSKLSQWLIRARKQEKTASAEFRFGNRAEAVEGNEYPSITAG
jgi:hypothetical protein